MAGVSLRNKNNSGFCSPWLPSLLLGYSFLEGAFISWPPFPSSFPPPLSSLLLPILFHFLKQLLLVIFGRSLGEVLRERLFVRLILHLVNMCFTCLCSVCGGNMRRRYDPLHKNLIDRYRNRYICYMPDTMLRTSCWLSHLLLISKIKVFLILMLR